MNLGPDHTPRDIITTALEDYWITNDLGAPFNAPDAADMALTYLAGHGFHITVDTRLPTPYQPHKPPSRASIAATAFLTLACLICTIASLLHHLWGWSVFALIGTGFLTHETLDELAHRRGHRLNF